ncbi:MAG TPA: 4Fe-4S dicluster domain-containing protein [Tepidisphaeraceae bacterium]|jgi:formate dehydrogenase iron-sulfur subunit
MTFKLPIVGDGVAAQLLERTREMAVEVIGDLPNAFPPRWTEVPQPADHGGDARQIMGFFTDTTLCIGCKACEVACKQWNQLPAEGMNFTGYSYDNTARLSATTWRHVAFKEKIGEDDAAGISRWLMMSDVCKHCQSAPCQHACPTGAIIYNEFGDVYVQGDICNGCGYCVVACPFGVIERSDHVAGIPADGHAHKCTLCYDRQAEGMTPACAKSCPTASIQFGSVDDLRAKARQRVNELRERGNDKAYLYGCDSVGDYGPLNSFFLLEDHPNEYNLPENPPQPFDGQGKRYAASLAVGAGLAMVAAMIFGGGGRRGR